jgi:hypothetical protein
VYYYYYLSSEPLLHFSYPQGFSLGTTHLSLHSTSALKLNLIICYMIVYYIYITLLCPSVTEGRTSDAGCLVRCHCHRPSSHGLTSLACHQDGGPSRDVTHSLPVTWAVGSHTQNLQTQSGQSSQSPACEQAKERTLSDCLIHRLCDDVSSAETVTEWNKMRRLCSTEWECILPSDISQQYSMAGFCEHSDIICSFQEQKDIPLFRWVTINCSRKIQLFWFI